MEKVQKLDALNKKIGEAVKENAISIRKGSKVTGEVVSLRMRRTATILINKVNYLAKQRRYAKGRGKIHVHIPEGVELKLHDLIEARPTKKISKTKAFVLHSILKRD